MYYALPYCNQIYQAWKCFIKKYFVELPDPWFLVRGYNSNIQSAWLFSFGFMLEYLGHPSIKHTYRAKFLIIYSSPLLPLNAHLRKYITQHVTRKWKQPTVVHTSKWWLIYQKTRKDICVVNWNIGKHGLEGSKAKRYPFPIVIIFSLQYFRFHLIEMKKCLDSQFKR